MSHFIIGLTGGIGSGKSTVTALFESLGVTIVDADVIAREVVQPNSNALNAIAVHFGAEYIHTDGQLNRSLLRSRVFSNVTDKQWLNDLLHPIIRQELITQTHAATSPYCILVAPLFIENKLLSLVNRLLVIDVTEQKQLERTLLRDSSTANEVKAIMASQTSRENRLALADDIINNNNDNISNNNEANSVLNTVRTLHQKYLKLAKEKMNNS